MLEDRWDPDTFYPLSLLSNAAAEKVQAKQTEAVACNFSVQQVSWLYMWKIGKIQFRNNDCRSWISLEQEIARVAMSLAWGTKINILFYLCQKRIGLDTLGKSSFPRNGMLCCALATHSYLTLEVAKRYIRTTFMYALKIWYNLIPGNFSVWSAQGYAIWERLKDHSLWWLKMKGHQPHFRTRAPTCPIHGWNENWNESWPFPVLWHCWVFQICCHIECSTLTASSFMI